MGKKIKTWNSGFGTFVWIGNKYMEFCSEEEYEEWMEEENNEEQ